MNPHLRHLTIAGLQQSLRSFEFARQNQEITEKAYNQQTGRIRAELARRERKN